MFVISTAIYVIFLTLAALIICCQRFSFSYASFISLTTFACVFLLLSVITGYPFFALSISSSIVIILQLLNQLKTHYYKERLFFSDFDVALDRRNFHTLIHYPSALVALIGLALFFIFNGWLYWGTTPLAWEYRLVGLVLLILGCWSLFHVSKQEKNIKDWQISLPKGKNTITNLFISAQNMHYSPPNYDTSADYFLEKMSQVPCSLSSEHKPDIITVLQESTFDPTGYNLLNIPKLSLFTQTQTTKATGHLRVHTFGGATWLSEFSVLTGLCTDDFQFRKNSVFYTVAEHIQTSIFKELKQHGYFTVVLSPMHPLNYNAGPTYKHLGVDLILQPQDLGHPAGKQENLWTIPSKEMLDYAKKILAQHTDKPVFIFMLTMAEHGPYDEKAPDILKIKEQRPEHSDKHISMLNSYFNRLTLLDETCQDFIQFMQSRNRETIFTYFGDHQPSFGCDWQYSLTDNNPDYLTQFSIHDNFSTSKAMDVGNITDISFLPGMILERTGLPVSDFFKANIALRHLTQGKLDEFTDKQLINSYKNYIYQTLNQAGETS